MLDYQNKTPCKFNLDVVHPSWKHCITHALSAVDSSYLQQLSQSKNWLPGPDNIFNAFSIPLNSVNYVLFGESPYPRRESANGYAFWDAAVDSLWAESGLSKRVNRATSLRNILKMLLVAEEALMKGEATQAHIAALDKTHFVKTNTELFQNFQEHGFLLLNASLVLQDGPPQKDAKAWCPFIEEVIKTLLLARPGTKFILFGQIACKLDKIMQNKNIHKLLAEHPYNLSFIDNPDVLAFFKPLHLLRKD